MPVVIKADWEFVIQHGGEYLDRDKGLKQFVQVGSHGGLIFSDNPNRLFPNGARMEIDTVASQLRHAGTWACIDPPTDPIENLRLRLQYARRKHNYMKFSFEELKAILLGQSKTFRYQRWDRMHFGDAMPEEVEDRLHRLRSLTIEARVKLAVVQSELVKLSEIDRDRVLFTEKERRLRDQAAMEQHQAQLHRKNLDRIEAITLPSEPGAPVSDPDPVASSHPVAVSEPTLSRRSE